MNRGRPRSPTGSMHSEGRQGSGHLHSGLTRQRSNGYSDVVLSTMPDGGDYPEPLPSRPEQNAASVQNAARLYRQDGAVMRQGSDGLLKHRELQCTIPESPPSAAASPRAQRHSGRDGSLNHMPQPRTDSENSGNSGSSSPEDSSSPPSSEAPHKPHVSNDETPRPAGRARYSCVMVEPSSEGSSRSQSLTSMPSSRAQSRSQSLSQSSWGSPGDPKKRSPGSGKGSSSGSVSSIDELVLGTVRIPMGESADGNKTRVLRIEPGRLQLPEEAASQPPRKPAKKLLEELPQDQAASMAQTREKILTVAEPSKPEARPRPQGSVSFGPMPALLKHKKSRFLKFLCGRSA